MSLRELPPSHRISGLNSYHVRTLTGELVYDVDSKLTGHSTHLAQCWLWHPEALQTELAKLRDRIPWAGLLTAERAR